MAGKASDSTKKEKAKVSGKKPKTVAKKTATSKSEKPAEKAKSKKPAAKAVAPKAKAAAKTIKPKVAAKAKTAPEAKTGTTKAKPVAKAVATAKPLAKGKAKTAVVKKETAKKDGIANGPSKILSELIVAGMQEMKALDIVVIDLRKIQNSICDFFVIASGNSSTHADAIAGSLEKEVKKTTGEYPWKREGFSNSEWILIDYVSVIAHVFQQHTREFYKLEDLWADADTTVIPNQD